MKKIICFALTMALVLGLAAPALAADNQSDEGGIVPYALVIKNYNLSEAYKSGSTIYAVANTEGLPNATSSYVRIDLYRAPKGSSSYTLWKSGTTQKNSSGGYVSARESWSTVSGYSYKVQSTHTAYAGSTKETKYHSKIFY